MFPSVRVYVHTPTPLPKPLPIHHLPDRRVSGSAEDPEKQVYARKGHAHSPHLKGFQLY